MAIRYKVDIIEALRNAGYSSYKIRQDGWPVNQTAMQKLRQGKLIAWEQLDRVCTVLHCQPGDLVEYVEDENSIRS